MKGVAMRVLCLACLAMVMSADRASRQQAAPQPPAGAEGRSVSEVTLRSQPPLPSRLSIVRFIRNVARSTWVAAEESTGLPAGGNIGVLGPVGAETLLMMRTPGRPGYLLYGPFRWPSEPSTYFMVTRWRKTMSGRSVHGPGSISWVGSEDAADGAFPSCAWTTEASWECIGVPLDSTGVVVVSRGGEVECAVPAGPVSAKGLQASRSQVSTWGRLLVVSSGSPDRNAAVGVRARRLERPRARPQSIRLEEVTDERVHVERVGPGAFWVAGSGAPGEAWVEIASVGRATERVETREIAAAPAELPLHIQLQTSNAIAGHVTSGQGTPVPGAVVTLFRFTQEPRVRTQDPAPRVSVRETRTDADGAFRFDDLSRESYEIVAIHPSLGRADRRVEPDGQDFDIALRPPPHIVGRVLRDGAPGRGIRVIVVPDLSEFAGMADITELRGGETETDLDGRFSVALGSRGSGELRIGDERTGVRRVPLGPAESQPAVVDVGTVQLETQPPVTLVLENAGGCGLLLTGPVGRTGLTVVRGSSIGPAMFEAPIPEPGRWQVVAVCGNRERPVLPAVIDVPPGARDLSISLAWPQEALRPFVLRPSLLSVSPRPLRDRQNVRPGEYF